MTLLLQILQIQNLGWVKRDTQPKPYKGCKTQKIYIEKTLKRSKNEKPSAF